MKILQFLVLFVFFNNQYILGQNASQSIIPSGGNGSNIEANLDWTVGQISISTYSDNISILSEGIQQATVLITNLKETNLDFEQINVYPNPASQVVKIVIPDNVKLKFMLYDINGKLLINGDFLIRENKINLSEFSDGEYFLKVLDKDNKFLKTFKINKL